MYQTESAGSGMMDGTTEAQLQSLGRPLLCQFSPANTVHFPLLFLIPLISGCTVFYNYLLSPPPHPINGPSLENMSYIFKLSKSFSSDSGLIPNSRVVPPGLAWSRWGLGGWPAMALALASASTYFNTPGFAVPLGKD